MMQAEIVHLERFFNADTCVHFWQATLEFEDKPEFKLGKCEVTQ